MSNSLARGGGGWVVSRWFPSYADIQGALADGLATITTDAGLDSQVEPSPRAQVSPGIVNFYNLQNLASVSLNEKAVIGEQLIKSLYGNEPLYRYWNGCSHGGRQDMMLAQRYPDAHDGIAAGAPAILLTKFFVAANWPR
ncbi:Tannase/feruloyl esterase [Xylariaceae sp. FL0255]|nr:Tannase/feruloyl esterase [Xylariaceae sp. FL0255]